MKSHFILPFIISMLFGAALYFLFFGRSPGALLLLAAPLTILALTTALFHRAAARCGGGRLSRALLIYAGACAAYLAASICGEALMTLSARLGILPEYQRSGAFVFGAWLLYLFFQPFAAADALLAAYAREVPAGSGKVNPRLIAACFGAAAALLAFNVLSLANY